MKSIAFVSFGKDSLAMLLTIIEKGLPLDDVIYVEPMFNDTMSGEYPEMVEFIEKAKDKLLKEFGVPVTQVRSDKTFYEEFYRVKQKGKHIGTIYGYPMTYWAWCNDRLKQRAFSSYIKSIDDDYVKYIGIAADETKRLTKLDDKAIAPLADFGITEEQALEICKKHGLVAPLYQTGDLKRIGCWFCPKQPINALAWLKRTHPDLYGIMLEMQKDSPVDFKPNKNLFEIDKCI